VVRTRWGLSIACSECVIITTSLGRNTHCARTLCQWLDLTAGTGQFVDERRRAIRLLVDLAKYSEQVPDGHHITGVKYDRGNPTWFGGFADVHEGTWPTSRTPCVVVKRLRLNERHDPKSIIHKVRHRSSCHPLTYRLGASQRICFEGLSWRQFDHPNIVKFLGVLYETSSDSDNRVRLALVSVRKKDNLRAFLHSTDYNPRVDRKRLVGVLRVYYEECNAYLRRRSVDRDCQCFTLSARPRDRPRRCHFG
jgi:hypothetical protein